MAALKRTRHGRNAGMVRVNLRGFRAIDRRKVAARTAIEWRAELLADLGGAESLTAARMALVESATRTWLYVQHLDAWCLEQGSLVNGRRKGVHPVVRERLLLVESLQRTLLALGLERAQPKAPSLADIAREEAERQERPQSSAEPEAAGHAGAGGQEVVTWREGGDQGPGDPEPEQAPEGGQAPEPHVAAAADQAARRVLGTWGVVERQADPVGDF